MPGQSTVNTRDTSPMIPPTADVVYHYDGSFEGFLCCVFESFARHEMPFAILPPDRQTATFYPVAEIATDAAHAQRVFRSLAPRLGREIEQLILTDFLSYYEDREVLLVRFLHLAFARGPAALAMTGHEAVAPVCAMRRHIAREVDKLQGFIRFEESEGMLGAVIHPKNAVLPLLRGHFCARFPEEEFLIYDATHGAVLVHHAATHTAEILQLAAPLALPAPDEKEQRYQALWQQFYRALTIEARRNEACRRNLCPKHYWADMTELKGEL
jgi:probable DNA metabolism protein